MCPSGLNPTLSTPLVWPCSRRLLAADTDHDELGRVCTLMSLPSRPVIKAVCGGVDEAVGGLNG